MKSNSDLKRIVPKLCCARGARGSGHKQMLGGHVRLSWSKPAYPVVAAMLLASIAAAACSNSTPAASIQSPAANRGPAATASPLPPPEERPVHDLRDAFAAAAAFLGPQPIPGNTVDGIDSLSYVATTVGAANEALGFPRSPGALGPGEDAIDPATPAWLFVEYGQYGFVSEHGSYHGNQGTAWVLAPKLFRAEHGSFPGRIDLAALGSPVVIAPGQLPALDPLRNPATAIVRTTADAVGVIARQLGETAALVSSMSYAETDAATAARLTGVSGAGLPANTKAWVFDVHGLFALVCGGDFQETVPGLRWLVVAGNSAPYYVEVSQSPEEVLVTPTPTPVSLSAFGRTVTIDLGAWPALDQYRGSAVAIRATATSWSGHQTWPACSNHRP